MGYMAHSGTTLHLTLSLPPFPVLYSLVFFTFPFSLFLIFFFLFHINIILTLSLLLPIVSTLQSFPPKSCAPTPLLFPIRATWPTLSSPFDQPDNIW